MASSMKSSENFSPPKRHIPISAASESYPFTQRMRVYVVHCMCVDHVQEICACVIFHMTHAQKHSSQLVCFLYLFMYILLQVCDSSRVQ